MCFWSSIFTTFLFVCLFLIATQTQTCRWNASRTGTARCGRRAASRRRRRRSSIGARRAANGSDWPACAAAATGSSARCTSTPKSTAAPSTIERGPPTKSAPTIPSSSPRRSAKSESSLSPCRMCWLLINDVDFLAYWCFRFSLHSASLCSIWNNDETLLKLEIQTLLLDFVNRWRQVLGTLSRFVLWMNC